MPYKDPEKQREYQREWVQRRRMQWISENGPCASCGSSDDLQVDHVDREEKIDHKVFSWSDDRRKAELSKCQVLCTECHKGKTSQEVSGSSAVHGTATMYRYGCRCNLCYDAKSIVAKRYRG